MNAIGIGCRYTSDNASDESAPLKQTMKIQLEISDDDRPDWPVTATWTGASPKAYRVEGADAGPDGRH